MPGKGGMLGGRLDQLYQEILATARAGDAPMTTFQTQTHTDAHTLLVQTGQINSLTAILRILVHQMLSVYHNTYRFLHLQ